MPIKFRCPHCEQFLGISRARAGAIADCPTCGRTIRVPQLDGRVAPLPAPRLDLKDSRLRNALGALASLDSLGSQVAEEEVPPAAAPAAAVPEARPVAIQAVPVQEPEPLPPASIIAAGDETSERDVPFVIVEDEPDPLRQLAALNRPSASAAARKGPRFGPAILFMAMISCLFCGWLIGNGSFRDLKQESSSGAAPTTIGGESELPAANAVESPAHVAVTGTVLFAEVTGKELPDRGARLLALPVERKGTVKLSHLGFRFGSDATDEQVFRGAVKALGGNIAEVGADGRFSLTLDQPGSYGLLITSRFQPRGGEPVLSDKARRVLSAYFDRPESLLGTVRFDFREIEAVAESTVDLQVRFPVE